MLKKILKFFIVINLIMLNACVEENLYQNFINEENDFFNSLKDAGDNEKRYAHDDDVVSANDDDGDVKYREMIHSMQTVRDVNGQQHESRSGSEMARQPSMMMTGSNGKLITIFMNREYEIDIDRYDVT
jgi:hypothetical protein